MKFNPGNITEIRPDGEKFRILVVDDSKTAREALKIRMTEAGYDVIFAENGKEAVESVKQSMGIDLIVMDVLMPEMNGIEACSEIKTDKHIPFIPILMQTTEDETKDIVVGLDSGADDYVSKMARPEELMARVRACLRIKYLHDELQRAHRKLEEAGKLFASIQTASQIGDNITDNLNNIKNLKPAEKIVDEIDSIWEKITGMLNRFTELYDNYLKSDDGDVDFEEEEVEEF